ncbi:MAG: hypothetical protein E7675_07630 [Ruminococcaceae bacterium]|nr:hypothetical protein [Oscillospiraceae bacterium]
MYIKRILSLFFALVMVFSFIGCSQINEVTPTASQTPPSSEDTTAIVTSTPSTVPTKTQPVLTPDITADTKAEIELTEEDMKLFKNSYDILFNRITDRGYAITSLTGTYVGMFTRDSAIQAMAHLSCNDSDSARSILRYLLSYHASLGLKRGTHIIDSIKDEEYRNNYLSGKNDTAVNYYEEQTDSGKPQFLINAPNNSAATPFTTRKKSVNCVQAYLEGSASSRVVAEIYSDLFDPDSLVVSGSYTFDVSSKGWIKIPLDSTVKLSSGTTYYLKLYAPKDSGRVVLYGIDGNKNGALKSFNYDMNAYGGNGWREVDVYTAFVIGESDTSVTTDYKIAQRNADTGIYIVNAPNNMGAQGFIPKNDTIYSVDVNLTKSGNGDTVKVMITGDYKNTASAIGIAEYTFGSNPDGWQSVGFKTPVKVTPGEKYYLVIQATNGSGKVVWNGTTNHCDCPSSYNYDVNAFGGWEEKPYYLGFEINSYKHTVIAQGFEARGNTAEGVDLTIFSPSEKGKVLVEIRSSYDDPETVIASAETKIDKIGVSSYKLSFDSEVSLKYQGYYYLVVSFLDTDFGTKLMSDTLLSADTYALDGEWQRIGYDFLANVISAVDKTPIITIDKDISAFQEIPTRGEIITSVKVMLSRDKDSTGKLLATLYKNYNDQAQLIDRITLDFSEISSDADWVQLKFMLPLFKTEKKGNYFLKLECVDSTGNIYWCGSTTVDNYATWTENNGNKTDVKGEASFEALRSEIRLISDYTQTDANYMLIHAWVMYVNNNKGTDADKEFIAQSYPIIKGFANYYIDDPTYFNKKLNLIYNPSLEHSRKIRYWKSYDLLTNVFASQALFELSEVAMAMDDADMSEKWLMTAKQIESGINTNLVTEVDGKKIYGEFYDVEDNMKFYAGISWVNLAPVAAQWYGMDMEIMKNTYDVYKKYASVTMYGYKCLATEGTLGTNELTRELIGKGIAWELMLCNMLGDDERIAEIVALELATAKKNNISVYPEFWKSEAYVTDPGNQEHCSWQVYAMSIVFPELYGKVK